MYKSATKFDNPKANIVNYIDVVEEKTNSSSAIEIYSLIITIIIIKSFFLRIYQMLVINYNTITNDILSIYELNNLDHMLGVVSQTRVSGGNRTHDPYANSLAHYPLDYQGTQGMK